MKKLITILFLISGSSGAFAQWSLVGNAWEDGPIRGLFFLNSDTGFAVGVNGHIGKTTDGGVNWDFQNPTSDLMRSVYFIDQDTGYVCGKAGKIVKTIDGGSTWNVIYDVPTQYFRSIDFPTPKIGFVAGHVGTILKTTDAGNSWTTYNLGIAYSDVIQLDMVNTLTGYAICADSAYGHGYIFKTIDGGSSWSQVYSNVDTGILALSVVDADTIYVGGNAQTIIKSTDGGASWKDVYIGPSGDSQYRCAYARTPTSIVMGDLFGNVTTSYDAGASWTTELIGSGGIFAVHFPDSTLGFIGDEGGNVYSRNFSCIIPGAPGPVIGSTSVCSGSQQVYTTTPVANADTYSWTVPSDAIIISGQGDTSIVVQFGSSSGSVAVTSVSTSCGAGGTSSLEIEVIALPQPNEISGALSVCSGSQETYTTLSLDGVSDYQWTVPSDATIISGQGDTSIVVQFGSQSGEISVTLSDNVCGLGGTTSVFVSVNQLPETADIVGEITVCQGDTVTFSTASVLYGETYEWTVPNDATIISGQGDTLIQVTFSTTPGDVTVTANNSCGPGNTTSINVAINLLAAAPTEIFGDTVFCAGDTALFYINSVDGASSYTWSVPNSNTILSGQGDTAIYVKTATGNGFVKVSSSNECGESEQTSLFIKVNPVPSPTITFSDDTLFSSSPAGNQWYFNGVLIPGAISKFYIPTENGDYFVVVTSPQGCSKASSPITVTGVGINSIGLNSSIEIYPNPTTALTTIHFPEMNSGRITIVDVQGRNVWEQQSVSGTESRLDVSQWAKGIYLLMIFNDRAEMIGERKLIVQ